MLLTLILDYAGGTYISQVSVRGIGELPARLEHAIAWDALSPKPRRAAIAKFTEWIAEHPPVPIDGMKQVWCRGGSIGGKSALLNVVNTARPMRSRRRV